MRYASSIRYGGQLIDAADVDYQAYKHLGLLCPNCKEPVFLQGESSRMLQEKIVAIPAHFKHFAAADSALVKQCEARVAKYDQKELELRATRARNQRLRLLQKWFWQILLNNAPCINNPGCFGKQEMLSRIEGVITRGEVYLVDNYKDDFYLIQSDNIEVWVNQATEHKEDLNQYINKYLQGDTGEWVHMVNELRSQIDINFQGLILSEIAEFLMAKSSIHLLKNCLVFAYVHATSSEGVIEWFIEQVKNGYAIGTVLLCTLAMSLVEIKWAEEFAKLQKQNMTNTKLV
jgi:hypothetical protein